MTAAWLIVALLEWVAWRDEPHWASGQPPRYYIPAQPVPPRPPTQELPAFSIYPQPAAVRDDAPTWIATPQMREELLGWPSPAVVDEPEAPELPVAEESGWEAGWPVVEDAVDPWTVEEAPEVVVVEPEPEPELEPEVVVVL